MFLPPTYVIPIAQAEISGYFGRLDALARIEDSAMLLSVLWELVATVLVILCWRDLPQRFWITYSANGVLAYISLPIYLQHFGLYR
jgi:tRNA pseudouridine-54 N-methylase